jgi:hypothetical protein
VKLLYKRIFILFSVALNIGFVIMAITMVYHHSKSRHERSWLEIVDIVHRLKLPEAKESAALDTVRQFRATIDKHDQDLKQARSNIILLLSRTGPLAQDQLHQMIEAADDQEKRKNEAFEAHVIKLRNQLGNEKGAQFFSLLLEHLKAEDKPPHR